MTGQQIPMFTFTLGRRESIGPAALRTLWMRAAESEKVSVGRKLIAWDGDRPIYTLYASQHLQDLAGVERRLRQLLESSHLNASVNAVHA